MFDPDFMLLQQRPDRYKSTLPNAPDVLLVVEAAESSHRRDQTIKLPVYAAAGIQEYWIADLDKGVLIIHRDPEGSGYRSVETRIGDDVVSPLAAPDLQFSVRQAVN